MVHASSPATSAPRDAARDDARASRKSPARIATMLLHRALTLGTPRRVVASSITSSWYSEPRWTSSHATPPVTASPDADPAAPPVQAHMAHNVRVGRSRLPPA